MANSRCELLSRQVFIPASHKILSKCSSFPESSPEELHLESVSISQKFGIPHHGVGKIPGCSLELLDYPLVWLGRYDDSARSPRHLHWGDAIDHPPQLQLHKADATIEHDGRRLGPQRILPPVVIRAVPWVSEGPAIRHKSASKRCPLRTESCRQRSAGSFCPTVFQIGDQTQGGRLVLFHRI